jgi:hypothetical protein
MESHGLALSLGYRLEHFLIEKILGKGGFGIFMQAGLKEVRSVRDRLLAEIR